MMESTHKMSGKPSFIFVLLLFCFVLVFKPETRFRGKIQKKN